MRWPKAIRIRPDRNAASKWSRQIDPVANDSFVARALARLQDTRRLGFLKADLCQSVSRASPWPRSTPGWNTGTAAKHRRSEHRRGEIASAHPTMRGLGPSTTGTAKRIIARALKKGSSSRREPATAAFHRDINASVQRDWVNTIAGALAIWPSGHPVLSRLHDRRE
jgi:hypothetical protein